MIVAALEPGNVAGMLAQGDPPRWGEELLRIVGAGVIGSVSVPVFAYLSRWFPVSRPQLRRNGLIHLACALVVGAILIVFAHIVASGLFATGHRLTVSDLVDDLAANELLLFLGLIVLSGLAHHFLAKAAIANGSLALHVNSSSMAEPVSDVFTRGSRVQPADPIETVEVKVRGLTKQVPIRQIDWIETQGNYLALHVGASAFLLRDTLASFQTRLDPAQFIRIHRRTLVAVDRIVGIEPAANGDGIVRLRDNQMLRTSRLYRKAMKTPGRHSLN